MRILVIEDQKLVAMLLKSKLEEEGYIVETAYDGIKGQEMVMNSQFDAVLLDISLPGKDGFSILKELRDSGISIPIMILTASDSTDDILKGFNLGADDYQLKSTIFDELKARLSCIIRRANPGKPTNLRSGDLILDTITHLAYKNGQVIKLTVKEYALLEYLMRNKNKILSRSKISKEVWNDDIDPNCNLIDVFIRKLRTKLKGSDSKHIIQSIHGVGYRLMDANVDICDLE